MLSAHANVPPVTQTAVRANLLEAFEIVTQLGGNVLRKDLTVFASSEILLTIQKPNGDLELPRILDDSHQLFNLIGGQFAGTGIDVNFGLLANQICKTTTDTGNFCQSKDDIALSFNVRVENTQNVLKLRALHEGGRPVL